jgi:hypothetical protein
MPTAQPGANRLSDVRPSKVQIYAGFYRFLSRLCDTTFASLAVGLGLWDWRESRRSDSYVVGEYELPGRAPTIA